VSADGDGPWVEPAEVGVRLLLLGPAEGDGKLVADRLRTALATGLVAAFVADEATPDELAATLQSLCRELQVAFLLRGDPARVIEHGADGVHLDAPEMLLSARRLLGLERLIGVTCDRSRHDAMVAGEEGADYVTFGSPDRTDPIEDLVELVRWWSELFVIPVAAVIDTSVEAAAALVGAGVDFLVIGTGLFEPGPEWEDRFRDLVSVARRAGGATDPD
jgi:thiamine-phosphate pyrophosphorylase